MPIGTQAILKKIFQVFSQSLNPEFLLSSLHYSLISQFRGARSLRRMSAAACLLGLRIRIPPGV
jgi:hypothetical protein